jgi:glycosyltransferase involved in cell wall biosynthesis
MISAGQATPQLGDLRVALVHDWLTGMRGGERVLAAIASYFPEAEIFTLLHDRGSVSRELEARPIHTSFIQRLPASATAYRWYLPLFPWAIEELDLSGFDLVISSSHCAAKSAITPPGTVHLCYCHTPMRYAWDQFDAYFAPQQVGWTKHLAIRGAMVWLRRWDRITASRVSSYAANSAWVAGRIERYYMRQATVIPPPVDTDWFVPSGEPAEDFYLVVSALSPYKRIDVAIEAFNRTGRSLVIVGKGPEAKRLARLAGPSVEMRGWVDEPALLQLYQKCRGLILPAVEDAGIVPLEAMACGRPALVLDEGGAAEAVIEAETGTLIRACEPEAVIEAIDRAESVSFNTTRIRGHALEYGHEVFARRFLTFVASALEAHG